MLEGQEDKAQEAKTLVIADQNAKNGTIIDFLSLQRKIIDLPTPENLASLVLIEHLQLFKVTTLSIGALNRNSEIGIIGEFGESDHLYGLKTKISIWDESTIALSIRSGVAQTAPIERMFTGPISKSTAIEMCTPITFKGANIGAIRVISEEPQQESLLLQALKELATVLALYLHIYNLDLHIAEQDFKYAKDPKPQLKPRQIKILQLMQEGNTTTQISGLLGFSSSTIHQEVILVYRLLGVHKKSEAISRAVELDLLN